MEEIIDLIATDESPSVISDKIKEILYAKSADRIDSARPEIASLMFDNEQQLEGDEE